MLVKLLLLALLASSSLAQSNYNLMCEFQFRNNLCTCAFLIYNPNGSNQFTIGGNAIANCSFEETVQIVTTGLTTNIPSVICDTFPKLETLVMEGLQINMLEPNPFHSCASLKTLRLKDNRITEIAPYTFTNTQLQTIDLYNNTLQTMNSYSFYNLGQLKTLNLGHNFGVSLPATVFDPLTSLVTLDLRYCGITAINAGWFRGLTSLNTLYLSDNAFTTIPSSAFDGVRNLIYLNMSYCKISSIPTYTFHNITRLQSLYLHNNNLSSISGILFWNLPNLVTLSMSNNNFGQIPTNTFTSLTAMKTFSCNSCSISQIETEWFSTMRNLVYVDLANNRLSEIPRKAFTATDKLETLYIGSNNITKLEARSFGSLRNLRTLSASYNRIDEVEHHFMNQSTVHANAHFAFNRCTQLSTNNFIGNKASNMQQMIDCFDNFDRIMIELETYNSTAFDWHNIRPNDEWEAIRVSIKAFENVHIGLTDELNGKDPLVEIRLGERDNRDSSIFERGARVLIDTDQRRLSENEMRTFYIGWKFGIVMVYEETSRFPFLAYFIRQSFPVNFFGLRTQITPTNSRNNAVWNVSRIKGNEFLPMSKAYIDIEDKIKRKMPIDLKMYMK